MLTKTAIDEIMGSRRCRNRLAFLLNVHPRTIDKWLKENDIMLTTALALQIISEETGLKDTQILEPVTA